jgi:hypothetical protein
VADVINLAAYPKQPTTTFGDTLDPQLNEGALTPRALELRMRDRRRKEDGGLTWYSDFMIENTIGDCAGTPGPPHPVRVRVRVRVRGRSQGPLGHPGGLAWGSGRGRS